MNIQKIVKENNVQDVDKIIEEWFYGKLDENFHYNTQNNEALLNYLNLKFN